MALTEEQIKNLKPGDIINVWGLVDLPLCNGNILVELRYEFDNRILPAYKQISTKFISIPDEPEEKPKYDPYRKVKKGDRVKPRIVYGRTPIFGIDGVAVDVSSGDFIVETDEGERPNGTVDVKSSDGTIVTVDPVYLELITPVEELEPYSVQETMSHDGWQIIRNGLPLAIYDTRRHPNARAAAEAECTRLNAEYKKENMTI